MASQSHSVFSSYWCGAHGVVHPVYLHSSQNWAGLCAFSLQLWMMFFFIKKNIIHNWRLIIQTTYLRKPINKCCSSNYHSTQIYQIFVFGVNTCTLSIEKYRRYIGLPSRTQDVLLNGFLLIFPLSLLVRFMRQTNPASSQFLIACCIFTFWLIERYCIQQNYIQIKGNIYLYSRKEIYPYYIISYIVQIPLVIQYFVEILLLSTKTET